MLTRTTSRAAPSIAALVIFAASILYTSAGIYKENQAVQAPLIERLNDPALFPGDPFADALVRYPSILWHVVGGLVHLFPMGPLLLGLFLVERLFVLFAAGRLARAFAPGSTLAVLGAWSLFAFAIRPLLGAGTIVETYFEQTGVAVAFVLLAAAAFFERRPIAWAVWTGLAFDATGLYGAYAVTYFGGVFLLDPEYRSRWRRWLRPFALMLVLALPSILLARRALGKPLQDKALWLAVSYARSWRHMYPGVWPLEGYLEAGVLAIALFLVTRWGISSSGSGPRAPRTEPSRIRRHAAIWSVVAASWLGLSFLAAYVLVSPSLLLMQPARATDLWVCFASLAIVAVGAAAVEWRGIASAPHAATAPVEPRPTSLAGTEHAAAIPSEEVFRGERVSSAREPEPAPTNPRLLLGADGAARARLPLLLFAGAFLIWRPGGWIIAAVCTLVLIAWERAWKIVTDGGRPRRIAWLVALWVLVAGVHQTYRRYEEIEAPQTALDALLERPVPEVVEAAAWAKSHSPIDAVFLLDPGDPDWESFRALSHRSIYTSWEEGTAINWSPSFATEWGRRMRLLGYDPMKGPPRSHRTLGHLYADLTDRDALRIRSEVRIRYWIVPTDANGIAPSEAPTGFLEVHRGRGYKILDLEGELVLP